MPVELAEDMPKSGTRLIGNDDRNRCSLDGKNRFSVRRRRIRVKPVGGIPSSFQVGSRGGTAGSLSGLVCVVGRRRDCQVMARHQRVAILADLPYRPPISKDRVDAADPGRNRVDVVGMLVVCNDVQGCIDPVQQGGRRHSTRIAVPVLLSRGKSKPGNDLLPYLIPDQPVAQPISKWILQPLRNTVMPAEVCRFSGVPAAESLPCAGVVGCHAAKRTSRAGAFREGLHNTRG